MICCASLAAACETASTSGSAGPASASVALADPCSLLTFAQVGSAISFTVNSQIVSDGGRTCTWTYADPNNMVAFNTARLTLLDLATFAAMRDAVDGGVTITSVGLGDAAFYSAGAQGTSLSVEKGNRAFTVSVLGSAYTTVQSETDERTLAGYVLARL
ncbi:MAG TPA: hypothetical protein VF361_00970 [Candidatus Limnocylindrales bacterium]|jgi:hypothetical protein